MKLDLRLTLLLGLGFFTVSIVWSIYNVAVPLYLDDLDLSGFMVGAVMTIDNVFAIVLLPFFGSISDRTWTRFGRRMPFLLVGIPLAALAFFIVPFTISNLFLLMTTLICLNFFMSIYRAPAVGLMPDLTPRPLRSKANGIINFMGGIGAMVAFLAAGLLFRVWENLPYMIISGTMMIALFVMFKTVKEERIISKDPEGQGIQGSMPSESRSIRASLAFLLAAIFFWFASFNVIETFFSTYGQNVLGIDKAGSSLILTLFLGSFLAFCIPSGYIAGRFGRKRTVIWGLGMLIIVFLTLIFIRSLPVLFVCMIIGGIGWALININSYPMVVEMTANSRIGKYTGYYYFFSMLASIASPVLYGSLKDLLGETMLFPYSFVMAAMALISMGFVTYGEPRQLVKGAFERIEAMEMR